jgi:hypothetical protein
LDKVHVFITTRRFSSFEEMRSFIDETYTADGDGVPSQFMREVGLSDYEPGCIEAIYRGRAVKLATLLKGASYADQWLPLLPSDLTADAAICVFAPNRVRHPRRSSLDYVGAFEYRVIHPEWFQRILRNEPGDT